MDESKKAKPATAKHKSLPEIYRLTVSEFPKLLPILYLCMIGIGMIFNYFKYIEFGINIFQYASIFDFLISPFEDYIIILFTLFSFILPVLLYLLDCYMENRIPRIYNYLTFNLSAKSYYIRFRLFSYTILILLYICMMAMAYGKYSYRKVQKQPDVTVEYYDNETISGKQIGKTNDILFIYQSDNTTKAIPLHALVKGIRYGVSD